MDYSPWGSKNLINQNWLKKFMQVGVDIKCMHTNFIGCDLPGFEDIASLKFGPNFPFSLPLPSSPSSSLLSLFFQVLGYPLLSAYPSFYGSQSLGALCSCIFYLVAKFTVSFWYLIPIINLVINQLFYCHVCISVHIVCLSLGVGHRILIRDCLLQRL